MANIKKSVAAQLLQKHFPGTDLTELSVSTRSFVNRVRPDLQRAIDDLLGTGIEISHFSGVGTEHPFIAIDFGTLSSQGQVTAQIQAPEYEAIDIGEEKPVECLKAGFWLLSKHGEQFALLMSATGLLPGAREMAVSFYLATRNTPTGKAVADEVLGHLEEQVQKSNSYRGKVLSLETGKAYSGKSAGITVHRLAPVHREDLILPPETVELLERNVLSFCRHRPELAKLKQSVKKGLLFYGPPGTGKTFTIRYLAGALPDHTTLLITAEQVGVLGEYMTLARLLQPSIVIIEDADLIARDRTTMGGPAEEALLNKLLNEMDGLREDAQILFILTTNRPEALEEALASRPGRIDQAIEFPAPNPDCRAKLVQVYARDMNISPDVTEVIVSRTEGVSASFIKELMRRSAQYWLERKGDESGVGIPDVNAALEEMLFKGGNLNAALLGGGAKSRRPQQSGLCGCG